MKNIQSVDLGGTFHGSMLDMVLGAGAVVQFVLLLLLIFSVVSWAIIIAKHRSLKRAKKENDTFLDLYMKQSKFADVFPEAKQLPHSPIAEVFRSGYTELVRMTKALRGASAGREDEAAPAQEMRGVDNVERALNRACGVESSKLESALGFLATTGSACPFIGLFGTVWGIMDTFKSIGVRGSATLAVVAPGISEALIATAAGLAAAIPAVIFYNHYLNRIRLMTLEMDHFASEFLNIVERFHVKRL